MPGSQDAPYREPQDFSEQIRIAGLPWHVSLSRNVMAVVKSTAVLYLATVVPLICAGSYADGCDLKAFVVRVTTAVCIIPGVGLANRIWNILK